MPYKIALTGHKGFLGQHLIHFAKQREIEYICLKSNILDATSIFEEIQYEDFQVLIHLASLSSHHINSSDYYHVNIIGSENLLKALQAKHQKMPLQHILFCSSSHVYKNSPSPLTETSPLDPISHYAISKYGMEQRCKDYPSLPVRIIRLFNTIGVGQKDFFLIPKIIKAFKEHASTLSLGDITLQRDFSDVRWIANRFLDLSLQNHIPNILNLCSNQSYSIAHLIKILSSISQHQCQIIKKDYLLRQEPLYIQGDHSLLFSSIPTPPPPPIAETLQWIYDHS